MAKYVKKPIPIEAFKFMYEDEPIWFVNAISKKQIVIDLMHRCIIKTLEGNMTAEAGDFIIKGIEGEIYPCKKDIFIKTYEKLK